MTLKELLDSGFKGYFYYDPSGLDRERRTITANTKAHPQNQGKPNGWLTGGAHARDSSLIFVSLAVDDLSLQEDLVKVVP